MVSLHRPSVRPPFSNNLFSETAKSISIRFHIQSPDNGVTKVCSNDPGHMTKMADMPKYGKTLKKSSPEPLGRLPWNLVCGIRWLSMTKFYMMTLRWPRSILRQSQIWFLGFWMGTKLTASEFTCHAGFIADIRRKCSVDFDKQRFSTICFSVTPLD